MSMIPYNQLPAAQQQPQQQQQQQQQQQPAGPWDHVPTLQQMPLPQPAQQPRQTPYTLIQGDYDLVGQQVMSMFQQLTQMGLEPAKLQEASIQLQEQWTKAHGEHQAKLMQLQATQDLVERGVLDAEAGALAMWRQVLPKEAGDALFAQWKTAQEAKAGRSLSFEVVAPRQNSKGEIRPSKLESLLMEYITPASEQMGRIEAARGQIPTSPAGILTGMIPGVSPYRVVKAIGHFISPGEKMTQDADRLHRQYMAARTEFGYDGYSNEAKEQFDHTWDRLLKQEGVDAKAWDREGPRLKAVRARGPLAKAYTRQLADDGGPLAADLRASLESGQKKATPRQTVLSTTRPDDVQIIRAILDEAGGDVKLAETLAQQRGYSW